MSYDQARLEAVRQAGLVHINRLVEVYDRDAATIIMLPGGMGSELDRSPRPFTGTPMPVGDFKEVWIDLGIAAGDGKKLEIDAQGHDIGDHLIVPSRPFSFVIEPYGEVADWARDQGHNYAVFPFDWRRPLGECAGHLRQFLLDFRDAVQPRYGRDPLATTWLVCHSQGGLVALTFMQTAQALARALAGVVTVATPFYGTITHMQRYFVGEDYLNSSSANGGTRNVARIIGTLPGPYALMPMDAASFARDGAALGLGRYPVRDNHLTPFDPYDPVNAARYPAWVRQDLIAAARAEMTLVRRPLPADLSAGLFHIRATADNGKTELEWQPLPAGFDPATDPSPVRRKGDRLGGDGTVPSWSAFLPQTPAAQAFTLPSADSHLDILEHRETLEVLGRILSPAPAVALRKAMPTPRPPRAGPAELGRLFAAIGAAPAPARRSKTAMLAALERAPGIPAPLGARTWRGIAASLIAGSTSP